MFVQLVLSSPLTAKQLLALSYAMLFRVSSAYSISLSFSITMIVLSVWETPVLSSACELADLNFSLLKGKVPIFESQQIATQTLPTRL